MICHRSISVAATLVSEYLLVVSARGNWPRESKAWKRNLGSYTCCKCSYACVFRASSGCHDTHGAGTPCITLHLACHCLASLLLGCSRGHWLFQPYIEQFSYHVFTVVTLAPSAIHTQGRWYTAYLSSWSGAAAAAADPLRPLPPRVRRLPAREHAQVLVPKGAAEDA